MLACLLTSDRTALVMCFCTVVHEKYTTTMSQPCSRAGLVLWVSRDWRMNGKTCKKGSRKPRLSPSRTCPSSAEASFEALNVYHSNVILIKNKKLRLCKVSIHDAKTKPQLRPTGYGSWIEEGGASLAVDRYNTTTVLQYNLLYKQQFLNITTKRRRVKHFSIFF